MAGSESGKTKRNEGILLNAVLKFMQIKNSFHSSSGTQKNGEPLTWSLESGFQRFLEQNNVRYALIRFPWSKSRIRLRAHSLKNHCTQKLYCSTKKKLFSTLNWSLEKDTVILQLMDGLIYP